MNSSPIRRSSCAIQISGRRSAGRAWGCRREAAPEQTDTVTAIPGTAWPQAASPPQAQACRPHLRGGGRLLPPLALSQGCGGISLPHAGHSEPQNSKASWPSHHRHTHTNGALAGHSNTHVENEVVGGVTDHTRSNSQGNSSITEGHGMKYSSHSKQNRQKPCEMSTDNLSDFVSMQVGARTQGPQECPQDPIKA